MSMPTSSFGTPTFQRRNLSRSHTNDELKMTESGPAVRIPRARVHCARSVFLWYGLIVLVSIWESCNASSAAGSNPTVGYDHRALLIDGKRRFLISGSIHYPRSTPQMWPKLIALAKDGGVNVIQTYVFWDGHERQRGKYYFGGRYDLISFLEIVHNAGLYVNLRIGPYISAEWNFGGFPEWLREVPGIEFRTDNEPFKAEMQRFVSYVVEKVKIKKLFYTQGGPIILSQVENEYGMIEAAFGDAGVRYAQWAEDMAVSLNSSVPWIMCKQTDAPNNIIDTCNGFYCDDYVPNTYDKPKMWTENWSGWFHYWGIPRPHRPVEDLAYATARFFQKGGSFVNYYMYHGGTNFGRTSAAGVTTSYDYDAPIDEYGEARQPKWGHLKDLHAGIKSCEPALAVVDGEARHWSLPGLEKVEIYVYSNYTEEPGSSIQTSLLDGSILCASFLSNSGSTNVTVDFFGQSYDLPAWSVSILPDCRTVIFNTAKVGAETILKHLLPVPVVAQVVSKMPFNMSFATSTRQDRISSELEVADDSDAGHGLNATVPKFDARSWVFARDVVGVWGQGIIHQGLLEQINITHDLTDYLWYTTSINVPQHSNSSQYQITGATADGATWLIIKTVRNLVHVFLNGKPAGGHSAWNGSGFYQSLALQPGNNSIALLCTMTGLWYAGPFYEKEVGGLSGSVMLRGVPNVGDVNLTQFQWIHQVGLKGEEPWGPDSEVGVKNLNWSATPPPINEPLVWYQTRLDGPRGDGPVVLDMGSMGKGAAWLNGHHLGRYWPAMHNPQTGCPSECDYRGTYEQDQKCLSECGQPSQRWYHVPREWLKSTNNCLILFEEIGGNVTGVSISTQVVDTLCSHISGSHPPAITDPTSASPRFPELHLDCGTGYHIERIEFASFGNPSGKCGQFVRGECHAPRSMNVVQEVCQGLQLCSLQVQHTLFGDDPCPNRVKSLAVQAVCQPTSQ